MVVAELEVFHSRPIAPTRRVSLGKMHLPTDPPPGFGGILLGGIIAANIAEVDPDLVPDLLRLTTELEEGRRIPQPRLRYRFQEDKIGLQPSRHRLIGEGEELTFDFDDDNGLPTQQVLGAVYAAGRLDPSVRARGHADHPAGGPLGGRGRRRPHRHPVGRRSGPPAVGLRLREPGVVGPRRARVPGRHRRAIPGARRCSSSSASS